jgi:RNA ligase (TIGR02306 family)
MDFRRRHDLIKEQTMIIDKEGMAWAGKVLEVKPIEGADKIDQAVVVCGAGGRWAGVVAKGVNVGTPVVVFLPDAIVPNTPVFSFMEKYKFKVSPRRFKGAPSEVLILSQAELGSTYEIGTDVTTILGVKKGEKELNASIQGIAVGQFPSFIPKTDEYNFQRYPKLVAAVQGKYCSVATKYDGSSCTIFCKDGKVRVCSRNLELKEDYTNSVWKLIEKYNLNTELPSLCESINDELAIQGELVGPGIQKNPLKLTEVEIRVFDIYSISKKQYLDLVFAQRYANGCLGMPFMEHSVIKWNLQDDEAIRRLAEGVYTGTSNQREGVVVRPTVYTQVNGIRISFKVINLLYKGE